MQNLQQNIQMFEKQQAFLDTLTTTQCVKLYQFYQDPDKYEDNLDDWTLEQNLAHSNVFNYLTDICQCPATEMQKHLQMHIFNLEDKLGMHLI